MSKPLAAAMRREATSGTVPARRPSTVTVAVPSGAPRRIGPVTLAGASTETSAFWPFRRRTVSEWAARSGSSPPEYRIGGL
ncbi:MAG TPA: hypothetical protein VN671_07195, partial [Solirubrobacterales bacterium]|nr:hypothetical protein [Solirubrobacterales bacterium]